MNSSDLTCSFGTPDLSNLHSSFGACSSSPYLFFLRWWRLQNHHNLLDFGISEKKDNLACCGFRKVKGSELDSGCDEEKNVVKDHLVVLVNGIGGGPINWKYMNEQFQARAPSSMMVHVSSSNAYAKTLDGFDVMGRRLADEILELISIHRRLQKISFVSHSMGGLIARYAVGILYRPGNSDTSDRVKSKPINQSRCSSLSNCGLRASSANSSYESCDQFPIKISMEDSNGAENICKTATSDANADEFFNCIDFGSDEYEAELYDQAAGCKQVKSDHTVKSRFANLWNDGFKHSDIDMTQNEKPGGTVAGLFPVNFVTIASPHLGCRGKGHLPILFNMDFLESMGQKLAPVFMGRSGMHLFLGDGDNPLLLRMAFDCEEAPFISALEAFQHRVLYSNASWDQMVGWRTSSIRRANEIPKLPKKESDPRYRHVMLVEDAAHHYQSIKSLPYISSCPSLATPYSTSHNFSFPQTSSNAMAEPDTAVFQPITPAFDSTVGKPKFGDGGESDTAVAPDVASSILPKLNSTTHAMVDDGNFSGVDNASEPSSATASAIKKNDKQQRFAEMEEMMLDGLQRLSWKRVDVSFNNARLPFLAHNLIQVKSEWLHAPDGSGVIWHIIDHLEP